MKNEQKERFNGGLYDALFNNNELIFKDEYYLYTYINGAVFKSWHSSSVFGQDWKFYGVVDHIANDVYTEADLTTIQSRLCNEAKAQVIDEIKANRNYYTILQKDAFKMRLEDADNNFKRGILYRYTDDYSSGTFNELFVKGTTPEQLDEELVQRLVDNKTIFSKEPFFKKLVEQSTAEIVREIADYYRDDANVDKWGFDYDFNNGIAKETGGYIEPSFDALISLKLNKIDLIVEEYRKRYNEPSTQLLKSQKLYQVCKDFHERHENKSCTITLGDGQIHQLKKDARFKFQDFEGLIYLFSTGASKSYTYRYLTGNDRLNLELFNAERHPEERRDDDLHVEDITKIEFGKNVIFEEGADNGNN